MMKKTWMITLVLLLSLQIIGYSEEKNVDIVVFGTKTCSECKEASHYIEELKEKNEALKVTYYDVISEENELKQFNYANTYKISPKDYSSIPTVYVGGEVFIGTLEIKSGLKEQIDKYINKKETYQPLEIKELNYEAMRKSKMSMISGFVGSSVFTAGLVDGVNPCSIAMMLFFISLLTSYRSDKNSILIMGLTFIAGIFLAYLGIGVGLFKFLYKIDGLDQMLMVIYIATFVLAAFLVYKNIQDYYYIKNNQYEKVKTQLPKFLKHLIHNRIRKNMSMKYIYLSAFLSGFVISFLEFFCTGQIYLPTIAFVLSTNSTSSMALNYLILYNIAFVMPLIMICITMRIGSHIMDVSQILVNQLDKIKLMNAALFLIISIYMMVIIFNLMGF